MKVKTQNLIGPALNLAVALCKGKGIEFEDPSDPWLTVDGIADQPLHSYTPSTDWSQGGPIIETKIDCLRKRSKAEEASLAHPNPNFKFKAEIFADIDGYFCAFGPTPLIAAMRCYLVSNLGEEIEVPDELS